MLSRKKYPLTNSNSLLFLDTSYSLKQIYDRELEYALSARDCEGLFDRVWSIHPLVGADLNVDIDESIQITSISDIHKFVEVSVSNVSKESYFACTNFLRSQFGFFKYIYDLIGKGEVRAVRVGDPIYLGLVGMWVSYIAGCPFIIRINGNYDLLYETTKLPAFPRLIRSIYSSINKDEFNEVFIGKKNDVHKEMLDMISIGVITKEKTPLYGNFSLFKKLN